MSVGYDLIASSGFRLVREFDGQVLTTAMRSLRDALMLGGWQYIADDDHTSVGPKPAYCLGRWDVNAIGSGGIRIGSVTPGGAKARTYTCKTSITGVNNVDGYFLVGANEQETEQNFVDCINCTAEKRGITFAENSFVNENLRASIISEDDDGNRVKLEWLDGGVDGLGGPLTNGTNVERFGTDGFNSTWSNNAFWGGGYLVLSKPVPWLAEGDPPADFNGRVKVFIGYLIYSGFSEGAILAMNEGETLTHDPEYRVPMRRLYGAYPGGNYQDHLWRAVVTNQQFFLYAPGLPAAYSTGAAVLVSSLHIPRLLQESDGMKPGIRECFIGTAFNRTSPCWYDVTRSYMGIRYYTGDAYGHLNGGRDKSNLCCAHIRGTGQNADRASGYHFLDEAMSFTDSSKWLPLISPPIIGWGADGVSIATWKGFLWDCVVANKQLTLDDTIKIGGNTYTVVMDGSSKQAALLLCLSGTE